MEDRAIQGVGPTVVEVWALYGRRVLDVQHLDGGTPSDTAYTIGESHAVALVVPPAGLPDDRPFALVQDRTLNFTGSMRGEVTEQGETLTLHALARDGRASRCGSTYRYPLQVGARCRVQHNAVTFLVNVVPAEERLRLPLQTSRRFWAFNARSLALFASVITPAYFATPSTDDPDLGMDRLVVQDAVVAFSSEPKRGVPEPSPSDGSSHDAAAESSSSAHTIGDGGHGDQLWGGRGGPGEIEPHAGIPSAAETRERSGDGGGSGSGRGRGSGDVLRGSGAAQIAPRGHRMDVSGEGHERGAAAPSLGPSGPWSPLAQRVRIDNAAQCETLDLLAVDASANTPPWALMHVAPCTPPPPGGVPQMARNFDPDMMSRNAGLLAAIQREQGHFLSSPYGAALDVGNESEDVWSAVTGTDMGPAAPAPGTPGNVGVVGLGSSHGAGVHRRSTAVNPRVRQARAKVKGALDHDIIRRIVRAHINEVRHCYAKGLARRPGIRGRVEIQFTIGGRGNVLASTVALSSLHDARVERCMSAAIRRWRFPKPKGGRDVVVTYPFVLEGG